MGDPETQVVMPRLRNDLVELFMLLGTGSLAQAEIISERYYATTIVLASQGYPEQYEKNKEIFIDKEGFGGLLFHAGTIKNGKQLLSNGGRVMNVTATGISLKEAIKNANQAVEHIHFDNKYYRSDNCTLYLFIIERCLALHTLTYTPITCQNISVSNQQWEVLFTILNYTIV